MTSSGTYTYAPFIDDILTEAWERCGKADVVINGTVAKSARRSLQLLLIDLTNKGLNLWQVALTTTTITQGTETLTLDPSTVDILDAYVTDASGNDRYMSSISRTDYAAIPNKTLQTIPTQYWLERLNPAPVMHLYPVPNQTYTLSYYRIRQPQDVISLAQTPDIPILWAEAITAGLASKLAVKFAPDRVQLLEPLASAAIERACGENRERVPLIVSPGDWVG